VIAFSQYRIHKTTLQAPDGASVEVLARQLVFWIDLTRAPTRAESGETRRFPVIFDSGFNGNLLIQEEHLHEWSGIGPADFPTIGATLVGGVAARIKEAEIWIYRDQESQDPPHCIEIDGGIIVMPPGSSRPRLPLLGMRALENSQLHLVIDGGQRTGAIARTAIIGVS
jgi:hypothetical protein